jgi:hypothetical protein
MLHRGGVTGMYQAGCNAQSAHKRCNQYGNLKSTITDFKAKQDIAIDMGVEGKYNVQQ